MSKKTIEIICAALLAIVSALRKEYGLPDKTKIEIMIGDFDTLAGVISYPQESKL